MAKTCDAPGCNRPRFSVPYCNYRSHQLLRQDEKFLKQEAKREEKKNEPQKGIPKQSKTQKERDNKYNNRVKFWKLENPFCKVCGMPTDDCHHQLTRGIHTNNEKYWIPLCRPCHSRIKIDDKWAKENELIITKTISRKHEYD